MKGNGLHITFVARITPDLVARGLRADEMVQAAARAIGGDGGGDAERAEVGAFIPDEEDAQ